VDWAGVVHEVTKSGRIPLPAVDSITFSESEVPAIALLAPGIIEDSPSIFVNVRAMPPDDRVALDALLDLLQSVVRQFNSAGAASLTSHFPLDGQAPRDFWAIYHAGGVNYEFYGQGSLVVQLMDLKPAQQAVVWGLLRSIARLTKAYPDRDASS
jgi:hypothetical protein